MVWLFKNEDYIHVEKKVRQKRNKKSKLPKPPSDYNGSKSIDIQIKREDVLKLFKKASRLKEEKI
jgi:hypothetical protein